MSWTTNVATNAAQNTGSQTSVTSGSLAVQAGDWVNCWITCEGTPQTLSSVVDGSANPLTVRANNTILSIYTGAWAWYLAPSTTNIVLTATYAAAVTNPRIHTAVHRPSATPTLAAAREDGHAFNTGPALTGNITVSGTDGLAMMGVIADSTVSTKTINGVAATQSTTQFSDAIWSGFITYSSGFTGEGSGTVPGSTRWVASIIAMEIAGGGSAPDGGGYSLHDWEVWRRMQPGPVPPMLRARTIPQPSSWVFPVTGGGLSTRLHRIRRR